MNIKKTIEIVLVILVVAGVGFVIFGRNDFSKNDVLEVIQTKEVNQVENQEKRNEKINSQISPLDNPSERIQLKKFGDYITPETSPVSPERFRGYHTGVDFEVFPEELNDVVAIKTMCEGKVLAKKWVAGYGGVIITDCILKDEKVTVLYGHLNLGSIKINIGETLEAGEEIGNLGKDKSQETDQERKHLHLSIHKGETTNLKGYVSQKSELTNWLDPCDYICN